MTAEPQSRQEAAPPGDGSAYPRYLPILLTGLVAIGPVSTDLYLPSLPAMRADLLASEGQAQMTLSAFVIGIGLAQLVHGPLSDRFSRRPVLIGGLLLWAPAWGRSWAAPSCATPLAGMARRGSCLTSPRPWRWLRRSDP